MISLRSIRFSNKYCFLNALSYCTSTKNVTQNEVTVPVCSENLLYPPIKPKYPPGSWGRMHQDTAWQWYDAKCAHLELSTMKERLHEFKALKRLWIVEPFAREPLLLDYEQYVTKTQLISGLPDYYTSRIDVNGETDEVVKLLNIKLMHCFNGLDLSRRFSCYGIGNEYMLAKETIGQIIKCLISYYSASHKFLKTTQYDESVRVEAIWDRYGIRSRIPPCKDRYDIRKIHRLKQDSRFQGKLEADILVRSEKPLNAVVQRNDDLCQKPTYPQYRYWPTSLSQPRQWANGSITPGYHLGNPCEFNHVCVLVSNAKRQCVTESVTSPTQSVLDQSQIGAGMVAGFISLVAQAYYQGYSTYADISRPLATQTIITDGKHIQVFVSQLNTLRLWIGDDANPVQNLCWYSPKLPLYHDAEDSGGICSMNDEAVSLLSKVLVNEPVDDIDSGLLPADYIKPRDKSSFIDDKVEEVIVLEEEKLYD